MNIRVKKRNAMTAGAYFVVAHVIRQIPDPAVRQQMVDHFATEFNKRSPSFDAYEWYRATNGRVAPNSARMSA